MRVFRRLLLAGAVAWAGALLARPAAADYPRYLFLPPASGVSLADASPAPRYAYGWFGVPPRTTWTRHFGYHRDYLQWKAR